MTKEPIYECERCGKTLERHDQGRYTWCETCRKVWTDGFDAGFKAYPIVIGGGRGESVLSVLRDLDNWLPFKVRE